MRNIYDIIAEQKAVVDINMASYDLNYTISHITNNDYYIQEGVGESIGNLIKKVIAFIKSLLQKIKDLIKGVINFFTGNKDKVRKMNQEIADANAGNFGGGGSGGGGGEGGNEKSVDDFTKNNKNETEKLKKENEERRAKMQKEREEREKEAELKQQKREAERKAKEQENEKRKQSELKKASDIKFVIENSNTRITTTFFPPLERKTDLANKFFKAMNATANELVSKHIIDYDILVGTVIDRTFKGRGGLSGTSGKDANLEQRIRLEINEIDKTEREFYVSTLAKNIISYLEGGDEAIKYLHGQEKVASDNLNKLLRYLEQAERSGGLSNGDEDIQQRVRMINAASSLIGQFVNIICRSIATSNQKSLQIAEKAKNDYIAAVKAKYNKK